VKTEGTRRPGRRVEGAHLYALTLVELMLRYDRSRNRKSPAPYKLHGLLEHWLLPAVADFYGMDRSDLLAKPFRLDFLGLLRRIGTSQDAMGSMDQESWLECVTDWLESNVEQRIALKPNETPAVENVLETLRECEKPARGESLARKYAGLFHKTPLDCLWMQTLIRLRNEDGASIPARVDLFCAGIPVAFVLNVRLVGQLCEQADFSFADITFPEFYALITDCQEERRGKDTDGPTLYGRIWNPPTGIVGNITPGAEDRERDPRQILLRQIRILESETCARAQLKISRHFPKTVELLDTWLEAGLSVEEYDSLTYLFDDGPEGEFQSLLNHQGLADAIRDLTGKIHRCLADAITASVATAARRGAS
jgi:hypothetical protein